MFPTPYFPYSSTPFQLSFSLYIFCSFFRLEFYNKLYTVATIFFFDEAWVSWDFVLKFSSVF